MPIGGLSPEPSNVTPQNNPYVGLFLDCVGSGFGACCRFWARGRFRFAAVPSDVPTALVVRAKAGEFPFTVASPPESEPVVLRLALNEG